ncbi:hypothetical protein NQ317_001491 [Molorchus minor]|uniref:Cytosine-specific methyltransferase n=1 Tax=Molorchus minor TaxID=1323400 RepID=A0ABQ9J0U5_9CUCU|nr:hypothetical protein NQ317_001491 [Molorchus minor]
MLRKKKKIKSIDHLKEEIKIESPKIKSERCIRCKQFLDIVPLYNGHPNNSNEEFIALTDDRLSLFTGKEENINENDEFPTHKITHFSIYDDKGHLCPFDTGLVESNVELFFSGYIKPVYEEDASPNNGVAGHDLGPINEWWTAGYDGGEKLPMGFSTGYAEYYLMDPSPEYEPIYKKIQEKVKLCKIVIEFLLDQVWENPNYEDLVQHVETCGEYAEVEDTLLQHAQFICDQVVNYDRVSPDDEKPLISLPCMRSLVNMAGVTFQKRRKMRKAESQSLKIKKKPIWTKAVTTNLVRDVFEHFFPDQIDIKNENKGPKKNDVVYAKLVSLLIAIMKKSPIIKMILKKDKQKACSKRILHTVKWEEKSTITVKGSECYSSALVGEVIIKQGDFVMLKSENPNEPLCIAKVIYMYDKPPQKYMFHGHLFCRGTDTILGETADPRELFLVDNCEDLPLGGIVRKAEVEYRGMPENWFEVGGDLNLQEPLEDDENGANNKCLSCRRKSEQKKFETPMYDEGCIKWKNVEYRIGSGVFLNPETYKFKINRELDISDPLVSRILPKKTENVKGSNLDTPEAFTIGQIENIKKENNDIKIKVRIFYRPENTISSIFLGHVKDLNFLYYTEEVITTSFDNVEGKCFLAFGDNLESPAHWSNEGPFRFYFTETYDPKTHKFDEVPMNARKIGMLGKGKGCKGKAKGKSNKELPELPTKWEKVDQPLRCMDVFAGCGGLSEGLHQSGISEPKWAIEKEAPAAQAFRLNNDDCKVFTDDCNALLKAVLNGQAKEKNMPCKGEVEMLVGGPPCQGFSGMNRFNAGQYSLFKNSLVVSYLSYCEYYRPKYFILENVRNFVSFKRGMVLKLTLRCLLAMGYQVTFGILQAGHYGVPQTRRRLILMAAAPGYALPKYPEPLHVFNKRGTQLSFAVDGSRYHNGCYWTESAPYRTICVRDAMSDLPDIKNGWSKTEMPYDGETISHFQKMMRGNDENSMVKDHVCKEMSAIVEARITQIPTYPGADWRDLPNIAVKLNDGTMTSILRFPYRTKKQNKNDPPRGVCQCATGGPCDPVDRQFNTLIPWCLPHTADRHNNWAGLYGRLEWDGFFGTTITNPEPMGKQGRVLHPEQNRVVSVRECARSQGFPDRFIFCGNILDKHRQVGNAVPPPLAAAVGREICKAFLSSFKTEL